jgi:hypothetical protein
MDKVDETLKENNNDPARRVQRAVVFSMLATFGACAIVVAMSAVYVNLLVPVHDVVHRRPHPE